MHNNKLDGCNPCINCMDEFGDYLLCLMALYSIFTTREECATSGVSTYA